MVANTPGCSLQESLERAVSAVRAGEASRLQVCEQLEAAQEDVVLLTTDLQEVT
jgi:hypothetical protein